MAWFTREKSGVEEDTSEQERRVRTEGLWLKCDKCTQIIWKKALDENFQCCPKCDHHFRISARERLELLFDGPFEEHDGDLKTTDPLGFVDSKTYGDRLADMQEATGLKDALLSASGTLDARRVHICAMELKFIGGSMGAVVGEKITRAVERSRESRMPLIIVSSRTRIASSTKPRMSSSACGTGTRTPMPSAMVSIRS